MCTDWTLLATYTLKVSFHGKSCNRSITQTIRFNNVHLQGNVVLNGTKCGGLWGWDLRTSSRMFEMNQEDALITCFHRRYPCTERLLSSNYPAIKRCSKRYVPDLRCAIDESESIVVAGGDIRRPLAINSLICGRDTFVVLSGLQ
ncbi:hypothetical protein Plhal703r1_c15g0073331 [Plasmopara halstedii]